MTVQIQFGLNVQTDERNNVQLSTLFQCRDGKGRFNCTGLTGYMGGLLITNLGGTEFNLTIRLYIYLGHLLYYAHGQSKQHIMYSIDVVRRVTMLDMESSQY